MKIIKSCDQSWPGLVFGIGETEKHVTNPGQDWCLNW